MKADAVSLLAVFEKKMTLEVPLFQRQYVWGREQQWEPLWDDISRKFTQYLDGRRDAPVHFLGAMVLDQKQTPTAHVEKRQVIDGQQRLTTLQIFVAAFRDFCQANDACDLATECNTFIINKGMMANPAVDKFKVWPTQLDREQFMDVIQAGSKSALELRYPVVYQRYARKPDPRPRMVEAYIYFYQELSAFFHEGSSSESPSSEVPIGERLEECFGALKNSLFVVAIDLDRGDDAQIIFETLNARGEPLLPADLLRNYVFLRAARNGEPQEDLYNSYWRSFDDEFWRKEIKQGRLFRPRSDLFMQHFLSSRQGIDIPIRHLFVEYKYWIERERPFATVADELATLSKQGRDFRRILEPTPGDPLCSLSIFLDTFDIRTSYPLLLAMLDAEVNDQEWEKVSTTLESYLLRRAVCGLTTKNYNRIFLSLTRNLRRDGLNHANLFSQLNENTGESSEWPSDAAFGEAWHSRNVYQTLNNPKIVYIFKKLNSTFINYMHERVHIEGDLTVEHLLPQSWITNWPLMNGQQGLSNEELLSENHDVGSAVATRTRNAVLQTFGNLTVLTHPLNSSLSNSSWQIKRNAISEHSLLPINQALFTKAKWDEDEIAHRADELLRRAIQLWPRE